MLRKSICIAGLYLAGLSSACASVYLAPEIVYRAISANNIAFNGVSPSLALGYDEMLSERFYAGVEVFDNLATIKIYNNSNNFGSLRTTYSYGASILPGINFDNTIMGYLRIGMIRTHFSNLNVNKSGAQYGLGIQWAISGPWSARLEYAYTKYSDISNIGHPTANQFSIGLMYHFC